MARPRKPESLLISPRPCRINFKQPVPPAGFPFQPTVLSALAKLSWDSVCQTLAKMGVLSDCDGLAVEGLCEAYADLKTARAALKARGGLTYETHTGSGGRIIKTFPEVAICADADKRFRSWLAAFGLSPSDRSRVTIGEKSTAEDFSEFTNAIN